MHSKRPLAPTFINRLDRYLLKHKPEIWSARTHLVAYYGLLFMAVLAAIAFVVPDDPRRNSPSIYWVGFVSLLSFIALIGWLIYLLRFNVFKRYGLTSGANRLITFLLYFVSVGTFVLFSYIEPYVETIRANARYTEQELVADIDKTNLGICRLEYDSMRHVWSADTVLVVDKAPVAEDKNIDYTTPTDTVVLVPRSPRITLDKEALKTRLTTEDSVQQLNDSMYVFFNCPTYTLLQPYRLGSGESTRPLTSVDIYRQVIQNYTPPNNKAEIIRELAAIRNKYHWRTDYPVYYYIDQSNVEERIRNRHGLSHTSSSIDNILERKYRWSPVNLPFFVRIFIYTTLILSLLLFAFRHTTAKTFFLSLLTGIILSILTSLILAFSRHNGDAFFEWILFYLVLAFGLSLTTFTMRKRSVFAGIAINLFLWLLPFIPLCIVANYYVDQKYNPDRTEYEYALQQQHLFWAEIGGLLLLLVAIGTLMHKLYRKWYAAPVN